jgi:hypothetical protein
MRSYATLFGESREALLDLVASAVESYHRQRVAVEKSTPESFDEDEADQGDFLHDFLHLNVDYLNRLARLGSNYSIVGARALERLYEWAQPPAVENHLSGVAGKVVSFSFNVRNRSNRSAKLACECSRFSDGRRGVDLQPKIRVFLRTLQREATKGGVGKREKELTFARKKRSDDEPEYAIPAGATCRVQVDLTLARSLTLGVEYQGEVVAKLGAHTQSQHVIVVQRERA